MATMQSTAPAGHPLGSGRDTWARPQPDRPAAARSAEQREPHQRRTTIRLQVDEPAYPIPAAAVEAMARAVRTGGCAVTVTQGSQALRVALVEKLRGQGVDTEADRVLVTPGSCQGLWAVLTSVCSPGAAVLIPGLHWPVYRQQAILSGCRPVACPLRADFTPDPDGIADAAARAGWAVGAIVLNSPGHPTGAVMSEPDLQAVLELAERHDWTVLSDEAYEEFCYGTRPRSAAALEACVPPARRRVFSTYSFSKSHAMTGCRVGYVVAPDAGRAETVRRVQEACIIAPPTPAQAGALAGLYARDEVAANVSFVRDNLTMVPDRLVTAGLLTEIPAGGWYALLDVSSSGLDGQAFAETLLDATGGLRDPGRSLRPAERPPVGSPRPGRAGRAVGRPVQRCHRPHRPSSSRPPRRVRATVGLILTGTRQPVRRDRVVEIARITRSRPPGSRRTSGISGRRLR